jgi:hypothetical protein
MADIYIPSNERDVPSGGTADTASTGTTGSADTADEILRTRVATTLTWLSTALDELPDAGDEPSPNARERIEIQRATYLSSRNVLDIALQCFEMCAKVLPPLCYWRDVSRAAIADLERMREELEAIANRELLDGVGPARTWRHIEELKQTINIFRYGPSNEGGEVQTALLSNWMSSHGIKPVQGRYYDGRGGLESTLGRIEQATKELDAARTTLAARVVAIETQMGVAPVLADANASSPSE